MTTKHKPASPLPWSVGPMAGGIFDGKDLPICRIYWPKKVDLAPVERRTEIAEISNANASYIAHAANAYPKLVEALRDLRRIAYTYQEGTVRNMLDMPRFKEAEALLRELGEAA